MIVALDGGLDHLVPGVHPQMVVSGVNLGPNLSQDSYHSGTMGPLNGLYGVPAVASSFTSFDPEGMEKAVEATLEVVERAARALPLRASNLGRPKVNLTPVISAPGQRQKLMIGGLRTLNPLCLRPSQMVI